MLKFYLISAYVFATLFGCVSSVEELTVEGEVTSPRIEGTLAVPIVVERQTVFAQPGQVKVELMLDQLHDSGFDRSGFWNQSGEYEHVYGGDTDGFFLYEFTGIDAPSTGFEVRARLSAESPTIGAAHEKSDVTVYVNGVALGTQTVRPDNSVGEIYTWQIQDAKQLAALKLRPGANELLFKIEPEAKFKHGLCIYGHALGVSPPQPVQLLTVIMRTKTETPSAVDGGTQ